MQIIVDIIVYAVALCWWGLVLVSLLFRDRRRWLSTWEPRSFPDVSRVSVIFAARDEERGIAAAVASMSQINEPVVEIIAVDDRSTDSTTKMLKAFASREPRAKILRVETLPDGWLGKTNALQLGLQHASGDWILFTDADVTFRSDTVARAVHAARVRNVDHVVGFPQMRLTGFWQRCMMSAFYLGFAVRAPAFAVEYLGRRFYMGVGAFNLIRRSALDDIGGFAALRLSVDEDLRLGEALKAHGYRCATLYLEDGASVEWQVGLRGTIRGLEKNVFSSLGHSVLLLVGAVLGLLFFCHAHLLAWQLGYPVSAAAILLAMLCMGSLAHRQSEIGIGYSLLLPLGAWLMSVAMVNSMYVTLRRGGVVWRDSFYPSTLLRSHILERRLWLRRVAGERSGRS